MKNWKLEKLFFPRSLRYQLLAQTLFILAIILLTIGLMQFLVMKNFLYHNEADTLSAKLMSLPKDIGFNGEAGQDEHIPDNKRDSQHLPGKNKFFFLQDISIAVYDKNGNFRDLVETNSIQAPKLLKDDYKKIAKDFSKHRNVGYQIIKNSNGMEQLVVFKPIGGRPEENQNQLSGILQMGTNTSSLKNVLFKQLLIFIILSALALAAGLIIYLRVLKRTLVPLSKIVNAVKNTNAGNLTDRLPVQQGQEEIDRLSRSFNGMLERLEESFEYERETKELMRRFIADASHELRTPLTSINGFVEVLLRGAATRPDQLYKALTSMQGESKRIIKLVEDLLFLTRLDQAPNLQVSDTNLTELIREMEPQLNVLAGKRSVHFDLTEDVSGFFESDKIKQVILNLFNNAVQHTDPNLGAIKLSLIVTNHEAEISIQDNGPGISEENLPHIFDRFYRADISRSRQYGGAGLGLSITKSIVEAHGGRIEVTSKFGYGSTFRFNLPL
jgi:two-component system, OmpR family, sensor kinase